MVPTKADRTSSLRDEFERLSVYVDGGWDHNAWYHAWLLCHVPRACELALDVGSGGGRFTRELAQRAGYVFGLDISPSTVAIAERLTAERGAPANLEFVVGDLRDLELPPGGFGCIVSVACLHHLELEAAYRQLAAALQPGGILLVLDLVRPELPRDIWREALAWPLARVLQLKHTRRPFEPRARRRVWREHGENDAQQLTVSEVRDIADRALPGAQVRRRLLWRYSLIWQKQ